MKLLLEIILSIVLHPIALVLMLIDIARRSDLSSGKKLIWALVGLLWGVGEILYIIVGDGALW
ncbi:MAG: PLDc N-terminal domain-containing protein [Candidatus Eremiobacteraeota bacterium]|nr:PLDc N-terminal domain-containing protein [Candidatus Eremiobacteraeota bacterium]MBC5802256.1 PLDc N-terminal domain-containing protein [Candidatus Eremiobacteraeota bacterium]MBC5822769.1 PLDc N-terminal domain-containing protein [Candidatus Eremiobacteraeota bacterium]